MKRVPEPELMDDAAQAQAYARADFREPHARFVRLLRARLPNLPKAGAALDLGCGPADVTLRVARELPGWELDAIDGARAMLDLGRAAVRAAGLAARVRLAQVRLPGGRPPRAHYRLLFSNSLLHHLAEPAWLWDAVKRHAAPDAAVFVMDLRRPVSQAAARGLVERYAADEPELLRRDFLRSLGAAYTDGEVRAQLVAAGLPLVVEPVGDRHWIAWGTL